MVVQTLLFWLQFFLYLTPILLVGITTLRKFSSLDRLELLIPSGSIFGISLFVFFVNAFSFFTKGKVTIYSAFAFLILTGLFVHNSKFKYSELKIPTGKYLIFFLTSALFWSLLIFWKGTHALIGSDTNLYYGIAHTFIKGNFPPLTPWQPDLPLSYHLGASQLLGAFYLFTNLSFEFLHVFFSCFFIFLISQIIIWMWKQHDNLLSFIGGNFAAAIVLISFGFFKVVFPTFPLHFPSISNIHDLFLWIRSLPTVNQSIEVYGAPINMDGLIYFIFHAFGLSLVLSLILITIYQKKDRPNWSLAILVVGLAALALVNESLFIIFALPLILGGFWKNAKYMAIALVILIAIVTLQGGIIPNSIFPSNDIEKSVLIFPSKKDIKEDFLSYHYYQEISKSLSLKQEWLPFRWFHLGIDILIFINVILFIYTKISKRQRIISIILFLAGISSLLAYNFIVPKYLIANGNRFLAFSFINLSVLLIFLLQDILEKIKKRWLKYSIIIFLTIIFFAPTIFPPFALLSINRFGENKLKPSKDKSTDAIYWIKNNLPFNTRMAVLDLRTPHPSGNARAMVQGGVFTPIFPGDFKAYTIEASPQYFDIAYYLSPQALKDLKIDVLLIDSSFYQNLLKERKEQLINEDFFNTLFFKEYPDHSWEKVVKIKPEFLKSENEIQGTIHDLLGNNITGRIYIDNEENFEPSYLRRALIFTLRDKDTFFVPGSGVYLNVEENINSNPPREDNNYNYLVLSKRTDPKDICKCKTKLIWKGLKDEVYLWEKF